MASVPANRNDPPSPPSRRPSVGDTAPDSGLTDLQRPLEAFRAKTRRVSIHPLELTALWIISAHLVFLPWALGAMRPWAQIPSLILSVLSLAIALLPRNYSETHTGANQFRLLMWPKLFRFPIFWIGLALVALIVTQALNPAWRYATDGKGWWMDPLPHKSWLPAGVIASFDQWNQWRMLVIYGSAWLTVCAIWVAFSRRRTVQIFLMTLAINGLLVALFGVAQRMLGNGKIYWFFTSPNGAFFSSFIYKNHGGAYLDLMLAVSCGLGGWYYLRGLRRMEKSNPSGVLVFFATCIAVSVLTSYARGATLIMLAFLLVCIVAFVIHQVVIPSENRKPVVAFVLLVVFGFFLKTGLEALRSKEAWDRLRQGVMREDVSLEMREKATAASLEMLGENWKLGVGAGSFRFTFPAYQHRHPDLVKNAGGGLMFWEHAHNDIVEVPIELGVGGAALLILGFGYWFVALARSYFWENPLSACVVFGLLLIAIYGWWDFPFQCPAILITWCALWASATMWARFEESGARG